MPHFNLANWEGGSQDIWDSVARSFGTPDVFWATEELTCQASEKWVVINTKFETYNPTYSPPAPTFELTFFFQDRRVTTYSFSLPVGGVQQHFVKTDFKYTHIKLKPVNPNGELYVSKVFSSNIDDFSLFPILAVTERLENISIPFGYTLQRAKVRQKSIKLKDISWQLIDRFVIEVPCGDRHSVIIAEDGMTLKIKDGFSGNELKSNIPANSTINISLPVHRGSSEEIEPAHPCLVLSSSGPVEDTDFRETRVQNYTQDGEIGHFSDLKLFKSTLQIDYLVLDTELKCIVQERLHELLDEFRLSSYLFDFELAEEDDSLALTLHYFVPQRVHTKKILPIRVELSYEVK